MATSLIYVLPRNVWQIVTGISEILNNSKYHRDKFVDSGRFINLLTSYAVAALSDNWNLSTSTTLTSRTFTVLDTAHRPVLYLKHTMNNVHTSQETHYVSATELNMLMCSIGLWRRYVNTTIKLLDTAHRPVLYLKHTMDNVHTSQETHYVSATELNMLMCSIGLWRWYVITAITFLDITHCPVFYLKNTMDNIRTSQEAHYVSATNRAG
jgi:hypothetical protein